MDDRRAVIVRAARELVDEGGVDALTMRKLGDRIGFTPPVIYEHVGGREAVIGAIADDALRDIAEAATETRSGGGGFLDLALATIRFALEHPGLVEAIGASKGTDAGGPGKIAVMEELAIALRALDPDIDDDTVALRAEVAWATIQGLARQVERGVIGDDRVDQLTTEAFAAYRDAWSA